MRNIKVTFIIPELLANSINRERDKLEIRIDNKETFDFLVHVLKLWDDQQKQDLFTGKKLVNAKKEKALRN